MVALTGHLLARLCEAASIFAKLGLAPSDNDNRRVIAAIRYVLGPVSPSPWR